MTELRAAPGTSADGPAAGPDAELPAGFHRHLMEDMLFARRASERLWNLQRQGRIATVAPLTGQEAAIVGVVRALDLAHDWLAPYYRELLGMAALGDEFLEHIVGYWRGHPDGGRIPDGVLCLPPQISLGTQVPHAAGIAWGLKLQGKPGVACTFIGDGATSEGDFYEGHQPRRRAARPAARGGAQQRLGDLDAHHPPDRGGHVRGQGRGRRRAERPGRRQRRARGGRGRAHRARRARPRATGRCCSSWSPTGWARTPTPTTPRATCPTPTSPSGRSATRSSCSARACASWASGTTTRTRRSSTRSRPGSSASSTPPSSTRSTRTTRSTTSPPRTVPALATSAHELRGRVAGRSGDDTDANFGEDGDISWRA